MKSGLLLIAGVALLAAGPLAAHDVPNIKHTHAFEQTGYGTYRQGHSVNGPQGSILIWSARPQGTYSAGDAVKFARPQPMTKAPTKPFQRPGIQVKPADDYGKTTKEGYGR
jgi:hypothetical protein